MDGNKRGPGKDTSSFESAENVLRIQNGKLELDLLQKVQDINLNLRALSNEVLYLLHTAHSPTVPR